MAKEEMEAFAALSKEEEEFRSPWEEEAVLLDSCVDGAAARLDKRCHVVLGWLREDTKMTRNSERVW